MAGLNSGNSKYMYDMNEGASYHDREHLHWQQRNPKIFEVAYH